MLSIERKIRVYDVTIREIIASSSSPKYQYYIGKKFIFGADTRFDKDDLRALYLHGYFDSAIEDEWKEI